MRTRVGGGVLRGSTHRVSRDRRAGARSGRTTIAGSEHPGAQESEAGSSLAVGLRDARCEMRVAMPPPLAAQPVVPLPSASPQKSRATRPDAGQRSYIHTEDSNELLTR